MNNARAFSRSGIIWIAKTAVFLALIITAQVTARPFGQLVPDSLVNMLLVISVMTTGLPAGLTIAVISPMLAALFGIAPPVPPQFTPVFAAGNAVYVLVWHMLGNLRNVHPGAAKFMALTAGAAAKAGLMFLGVVHFVMPHFVVPMFGQDLPPQIQASTANMFSVNQIIAALIGGAAALAAIPLIKMAADRGQC